jgi:Amt family ammonium transporter
MAAMVIGGLAGVACAAAVRLKFRLGYDDSLDVLGVHGVGGLLGMVLLGLLATRSINPAGADGLLVGGSASFFGWEVLAAVVVAVFSFSVTWLIAKALDMTIGLRVSAEDEFTGLDLTQHSESAYALGGMGRISS